MCYELFHHCNYCQKEYPCSDPNYICPTINSDENRNMCRDCEKKEAEAFQRWIDSNPDGEIPSLDEWEKK